ncbi:GNAT family N-acetyltransferase [Arthrobacter sp. zg-Y1219]|uniref:GNAT family N-acetyltransferase n=1 Tax=Arthrobacter sp. zg-Y1219 TaxID=3049067 RepID=UPI0024C37563|nr:GNAT family N-acetyltransferase [Arthrobacter sp. zg-Y1219]MDK1359098.1 GNAT family N-acetyltransferase [Arthrobacter sp. zg-Y1219]
MDVVLRTPGVDELGEICSVLGKWQHDGEPLQLHPGDLGWYSLRGPAATAAATRVWSQGDTNLAIALLDGPELLRFAIDPTRRQDAALALRIVVDVNNPMAGILGAGAATIEARGAVALIEQLAQNDWAPHEPWTPLHHDLAASPKASGFVIETVEPGHTAEWVAVHWSAFRGTPIPDGRIQHFVDGWRLAAESPFLDFGRILSLRCRDGQVVAVAAVWSAGEGRPGLIEPLAVHQEHRGRGYGTVMTKAAVDELRQMGSSSAVVCAETSNAGAVATYLAAGFTAHPEVTDWHRSV